MSVLSTGKPTIEIAKLDEFDNIGTWFEVDTPKDGTTSLDTSKGEETEYRQEGKGIVDKEVGDSTYNFVFDLFVKKGFKKPIEDVNGVIVDNYAVRLSPKDKKATGFIIYKAQVSCLSTYSTADGMICRYEFAGLQTDDHANVTDYWIAANQLAADVNVVDIPATGETLTATVTATIGTGDTLTAVADEGDTWISTSVSDGVVTITATGENDGARREGWVTLTAGKQTARIRVNQLAETE